MEIRAGTSGYSYKEWKGSFYPEKCPPKDMLAFYAERLPAVEINNTFYRMPKREVVESWAAQTPAGFRFAIKVSQRITHRKRLKDVEEEVDYLIGQLDPLGERLGVLLVQLPPNAKQNLERLERFLDHLGHRARASFEFRHESWEDEAVLACLRERGAAWVTSETAEAEAALHETAGFGYLRLRREDYTTPDLVAWADRLRATAWDETFVFFKHERVGPALAAEFGALAGARPAVRVSAKAKSTRKREAG
jgi:uncharacterized protein YecE (DUF72 family)